MLQCSSSDIDAIDAVSQAGVFDVYVANIDYCSCYKIGDRDISDVTTE